MDAANLPLAGRRIGVIVRQSKTWNVGNYSTSEMDGDDGRLAEHIRELGGEPVIYNENKHADGRGVSGRDRVPPAIRARIQELVDLIEAKDEAMAQAEARHDAQAHALSLAAGFDDVEALAHLFDTMPQAQQDAVYRALVTGVRIRGVGRGSGRRHELVLPYRPVLAHTLLAGTSPARWVAHLSTLGRLVDTMSR